MFAGTIGSSKSTITNYLSTKILFPVFSNDSIRHEVIADFSTLNHEEYVQRRNTRINEILKSNTSFIYDASIDRTWGAIEKELTSNNYKVFIISLDLSVKLFARLYKAKEPSKSLEDLEEYISNHKNFLDHQEFLDEYSDEYSDDINLHITDHNFSNRTSLSYQKVKEYLGELETENT